MLFLFILLVKGKDRGFSCGARVMPTRHIAVFDGPIEVRGGGLRSFAIQ